MNNEKKFSLIISKDITNKYKINLIEAPHSSTLPMPPLHWLKTKN